MLSEVYEVTKIIRLLNCLIVKNSNLYYASNRYLTIRLEFHFY